MRLIEFREKFVATKTKSCNEALYKPFKNVI